LKKYFAWILGLEVTTASLTPALLLFRFQEKTCPTVAFASDMGRFACSRRKLICRSNLLCKGYVRRNEVTGYARLWA